MQRNAEQIMVLLDPGKAAAGMVVRPAFYEKLGGFDENFYPAYAEDCDLFWRVRQSDIVWSGFHPNNFTPSWDSVPGVPPHLSRPPLFNEASSNATTFNRNHCYL